MLVELHEKALWIRKEPRGPLMVVVVFREGQVLHFGLWHGKFPGVRVELGWGRSGRGADARTRWSRRLVSLLYATRGGLGKTELSLASD